MLGLWLFSMPVLGTTISEVPVQPMTGLLLPVLVILGLVFVICVYGFYLQNKAIKKLTKECCRVNTVAIGMGQHILAIEKHIIGLLGQDTQQQHDNITRKVHGLLISGASIDEVTKLSGLSHAEISLIASLIKSGSADNVYPINNFKQR